MDRTRAPRQRAGGSASRRRRRRAGGGDRRDASGTTHGPSGGLPRRIDAGHRVTGRRAGDADRARDRGAGDAGGGHEQPHGRPAAGDLEPNGERSRHLRPGQARRAQPHRGSDGGHTARLDLALAPSRPPVYNWARREEATMSTLSRRTFLRTSTVVLGATAMPSVMRPKRAGAADKELVPKKLPFPPNDEFGSYEPTITPDGNTIYFARFAGSGDKRVLGTTTDIFVTHRIKQSGEWPGTGADWTPPERLPDTVNS